MGLFLGRENSEARVAPLFPPPPIPPFLGADINGNVTDVAARPDLALTNSTVWACVSLLAGTISSLPLESFTPNPDGGVPLRTNDPPLLRVPDDRMTQSEWLHMLMVSLLMRGNAYGRIIARDYRGYATRIHLLSPDSVKVIVDRDTGEVTYKVGVKNTPIPNEDMWHVRGLTLPGAVVGLSPISYAAAIIGVDLAARQFSAGFFEGGGIPKAVLESDQQVNQEQARSIKDRVMSSLRGRDPLVLGLGLKYTQIQVKPEESMFLATQQATVSQIARFFGPTLPTMVGGNEGTHLTYSNREQRSLDFLTYDVTHWIKRVEDAVFSLLPGGQFVRFNTQSLLRTDAETQAKVLIQYIAGRVIAPSEVRAVLGRPPMTEAEKEESNLVPLTITPMGNPKALPELKVPPGDEAIVPEADTPTGA